MENEMSGQSLHMIVKWKIYVSFVPLLNILFKKVPETGKLTPVLNPPSVGPEVYILYCTFCSAWNILFPSVQCFAMSLPSLKKWQLDKLSRIKLSGTNRWITHEHLFVSHRIQNRYYYNLNLENYCIKIDLWQLKKIKVFSQIFITIMKTASCRRRHI